MSTDITITINQFIINGKIINPITGRLIKVGGSTYCKMIKEPNIANILNTETINPFTGKVIKIGGPTYCKLLKNFSYPKYAEDSYEEKQSRHKYYCLKCKDKHHILDPEVYINDCAQNRVKGTCKNCGANMNSICKL